MNEKNKSDIISMRRNQLIKAAYNVVGQKQGGSAAQPAKGDE
jgi:hypothetical protein